MRRISIFIGLKIIELATILFIGAILYVVGKWNPLGMTGAGDAWWHYVGAGLVHAIIILGGGGIVAVLLCWLIIQNWEWSGRA